MVSLQTLLAELAARDAAHDLPGLRRVREQILAEHPDSDAASEALYKVGLDLLFRERSLEPAMARFEEAARRRQPFWSAAARTSLGLCLYHQRRTQKALFELRKVGYAKQVNVHSVTALAFIENIFVTEGQQEEAARVRKDRIGQLEELLREAAAPASERGYHLYQLGLALRDHGDPDRAKKTLEEAQALGAPVLGEALCAQIDAALAG